MVEKAIKNVFLIQIGASSFAEFEISEFEYRKSTVYNIFTRAFTLRLREIIFTYHSVHAYVIYLGNKTFCV